MFKMSQINHIKDLHQCGYKISEIQKLTGASRKTIRKYILQEDFSPAMPNEEKRPSILDPFKETIDAWLNEDQKNWHKQRHSAQRIYNRLVEEYGFEGSYSVIQRYVKSARAKQKQQRANQELVWDPGYAQGDFGEADFYEEGVLVRRKYLTLSFPYSNDGFSQVFCGETAECVCQGLQDIFRFIGGVPPVIVFDNATGIGRRICDEIHESELFARFRAHHHFQIRFCNPQSGWEKGNVERKVGYNRSNLFVPVPHYDDIEEYNRQLLPKHEIKASERHYKKGERISTLFETDKQALMPLPPKRFNVCRYEYVNADKYGKICLGGHHYYSTCPENSCRKGILIGIRAHYIDVFDDQKKILVRHRRKFGKERTDSIDYSTTVNMLMHRPGAWNNSGVRKVISDPLREFMDHADKHERKTQLHLMQELTAKHGFLSAIEAMDRALRDGRLNASDARIIAGRITGYGIDTPPAEGPSLAVYDQTFLGEAKGGALS